MISISSALEKLVQLEKEASGLCHHVVGKQHNATHADKLSASVRTYRSRAKVSLSRDV